MPLKDPEARRAYDRMWRQRDKAARNARTLAYKRQRRATDPEFAERERARCRTLPQHVKKAHRIFHAALKRGEIVRPDICEDCGQRAYIEAAHNDYEKPLQVRWLCRSCHRAWDALEPKAEWGTARACGLR